MPVTKQITFSSLPREIRDLVYSFALGSAHSRYNHCCHCNWRSDGRCEITALRCSEVKDYLPPYHHSEEDLLLYSVEKLPLLRVASRSFFQSRIAKEICEVFFTNNVLRLGWTSLPSFISGSSGLFVRFSPPYVRDPRGGFVRPGSAIQHIPKALTPGHYIRDLTISIDLPLDTGEEYTMSEWEEKKYICTSSRTREEYAKITKTLETFFGCPALRRLEVTLKLPWINISFEKALLCIQTIRPVCMALQEKLGFHDYGPDFEITESSLQRPFTSLEKGLSVRLIKEDETCGRDIPRKWLHQVKWIGSTPDEGVCSKVMDESANAEEKMWVLMADGIPGMERELVQAARLYDRGWWVESSTKMSQRYL